MKHDLFGPDRFGLPWSYSMAAHMGVMAKLITLDDAVALWRKFAVRFPEETREEAMIGILRRVIDREDPCERARGIGLRAVFIAAAPRAMPLDSGDTMRVGTEVTLSDGREETRAIVERVEMPDQLPDEDQLFHVDRSGVYDVAVTIDRSRPRTPPGGGEPDGTYREFASEVECTCGGCGSYRPGYPFGQRDSCLNCGWYPPEPPATSDQPAPTVDASREREALADLGAIALDLWLAARPPQATCSCGRPECLLFRKADFRRTWDAARAVGTIATVSAVTER